MHTPQQEIELLPKHSIFLRNLEIVVQKTQDTLAALNEDSEGPLQELLELQKIRKVLYEVWGCGPAERVRRLTQLDETKFLEFKQGLKNYNLLTEPDDLLKVDKVVDIDSVYKSCQALAHKKRAEFLNNAKGALGVDFFQLLGVEPQPSDADTSKPVLDLSEIVVADILELPELLKKKDLFEIAADALSARTKHLGVDNFNSTQALRNGKLSTSEQVVLGVLNRAIEETFGNKPIDERPPVVSLAAQLDDLDQEAIKERDSAIPEPRTDVKLRLAHGHGATKVFSMITCGSIGVICFGPLGLLAIPVGYFLGERVANDRAGVLENRHLAALSERKTKAGRFVAECSSPGAANALLNARNKLITATLRHG